MDKTFGAFFCIDNGRPAISARLMVSLTYLKYTFDLSDELVTVIVTCNYHPTAGAMRAA